MLSDVIELFRSIYEACGELYEYASLIGERQTNAIQNEIFKQYELELKLIHARAELSEQNELHRLAYRNAELIPRKRFLFFRNKAAKLNDGEVGTVVENYFEERLAALTALNKAVKRLKELSDSEDPLERLWDLLAKAVDNAEPADVPAEPAPEPTPEPAPEPAPNTVQKPADVPPAVVTGQTAESAANESPKPVEKPAEPAQKPVNVHAEPASDTAQKPADVAAHRCHRADSRKRG